MNSKYKWIVGALVAASLSVVHAAPPPANNIPLPPEVAEGATDAIPLPEPEVRVVKRDKTTEQEYWVNGHRYMVKVMPKFGAPYYLIDQKGDGEMKKIDSGRSNVMPKWVLVDF